MLKSDIGQTARDSPIDPLSRRRLCAPRARDPFMIVSADRRHSVTPHPPCWLPVAARHTLVRRVGRDLAITACIMLATAGVSTAGHDGESAAEPGRATSHRSFADVEQWSAVFDDPSRDAWQKPDEVIGALRLKPGHTVADLGAGTGYFVSPLARAVGDLGAVYAVEIEPSLVAHLRKRAEEEGLPRVIPVLASKDIPRLPTGRIDLILIVDTFHHLDHRGRYLGELSRALTPLGRVAIIDWKKEPLPEGPLLEHKLAREQVVAEMTAAGFQLHDAPDFLPYQYFLIFQKAEALLPNTP